MQAYLMLGNEKYLRAAANGLRMVQEQSYATGGWGPNEAFVEPGKGLLAASLGTTRSSFETPCGAYGQFKITRYLLRVTRDSRYGDSMEQVLYIPARDAAARLGGSRKLHGVSTKARMEGC